MKPGQIAQRLTKLHFEDKWSKAQLAEHAGLSRPIIDRAMDGFMSVTTQTRLIAMFKMLPDRPPARKKGLGEKKRFLMRLYNLKRWLELFEYHTGIKKFKYHRFGTLTKEQAGYVCAKLDYKLKWYLLHLFGEKLKAKKVSLGDCYPAEQWVKRIRTIFPREHEELMKDLSRRGK